MNPEETSSGAELAAAPDAADADNHSKTATPALNTDAETVLQAQTEASAHDDRLPPIEPASPDIADVRHVSLIFRDGLDMPIEGLELFVTLPSGPKCTALSTAQGAITVPVPVQASGQAKVEVKDGTGKRQQVCSIDLEKCKDAVIIRSPKVKAALPLRPHQQTSSPAASSTPPITPVASTPAPATEPAHVNTSEAWWSANGAWQHAKTWLTNTLHLNEPASASASASAPKTPVSATTLSTAGQPVTAITGPECPNKDQLRLGRNNIYRPAILDAAKRLGLIPQALCALMDCEAGKVLEQIPKLGPNGKQLTDKKGKALTTPVRELWNANAGNQQSAVPQVSRNSWPRHG
jgi:hypothetical protein